MKRRPRTLGTLNGEKEAGRPRKALIPRLNLSFSLETPVLASFPPFLTPRPALLNLPVRTAHPSHQPVYWHATRVYGRATCTAGTPTRVLGKHIYRRSTTYQGTREAYGRYTHPRRPLREAYMGSIPTLGSFSGRYKPGYTTPQRDLSGRYKPGYNTPLRRPLREV